MFGCACQKTHSKIFTIYNADMFLNYFFRADLKHYRLRTDSITPKMDFIADYVMKGRILVLPIQGKGVANITMGTYFNLVTINFYFYLRIVEIIKFEK